DGASNRGAREIGQDAGSPGALALVPRVPPAKPVCRTRAPRRARNAGERQDGRNRHAAMRARSACLFTAGALASLLLVGCGDSYIVATLADAGTGPASSAAASSTGGFDPDSDAGANMDGRLTFVIRDFKLYNAADPTTNPDFENVPKADQQGNP